MLAAIGVRSSAELFADIPEEFRFPTLDIPEPLSEFELRQEIGALADPQRHTRGLCLLPRSRGI